MRSIIGNKKISSEQYRVSMARDRSSRHAFLILEGVDDEGQRMCWHTDLVINMKEGNLLNKFIPPSITNGSNSIAKSAQKTKDILGSAPLPLQEGKVRFNTMTTDEEFEELAVVAQNYVYQTYKIPRERAETLLENVKTDQKKTIYYNYLGDGSTYNPSFCSQEHHSCVSWCKSKLEQIGIPVISHWPDIIFIHPNRELPDNDQHASSNCMLF